MTRILDDGVVRRAMKNAGEAVISDAPGVGSGVADDRTTAQGLFVYAEAYLASAENLFASNLRIPHGEAPQRFLAFHAAELYLKAFLRLRGLTVGELEFIGHRFERLLEESKNSGLTISDEVSSLFIFSDKTLNVIQARYIQTGFTRQWPLDALLNGVRSIRNQVVDFPDRQTGIIVWGEGGRR